MLVVIWNFVYVFFVMYFASS